ncbi:MAG: hypothetical protein NUW37_05480 [Planctomycetes bacterium]|nr:hypothetical protein [Planctomycetota bacterium]
MTFKQIFALVFVMLTIASCQTKPPKPSDEDPAREEPIAASGENPAESPRETNRSPGEPQPEASRSTALATSPPAESIDSDFDLEVIEPLADQIIFGDEFLVSVYCNRGDAELTLDGKPMVKSAFSEAIRHFLVTGMSPGEERIAKIEAKAGDVTKTAFVRLRKSVGFEYTPEIRVDTSASPMIAVSIAHRSDAKVSLDGENLHADEIGDDRIGWSVSRVVVSAENLTEPIAPKTLVLEYPDGVIAKFELTLNPRTGGIWSESLGPFAPELVKGMKVVDSGDNLYVFGGTISIDDESMGRVIDLPAYGAYYSYSPSDGKFVALNADGAPSPRTGESVVCAGSKVIVFGGAAFGSEELLADGGVYDIESDAWAPLQGPSRGGARANHTAVWTGTEMIVYGGMVNPSSPYGIAYNPETETWRTMEFDGAPVELSNHSAAWTGSKMLLYGGRIGEDKIYLTDLYSYDPKTTEFVKLTGSDYFAGRLDHSAIFANGRMIVYGGRDEDGPCRTALAYSPETDDWELLTAISRRGMEFQGAFERSDRFHFVDFDFLQRFGESSSPRLLPTFVDGEFDPDSRSWSFRTRYRGGSWAGMHFAAHAGEFQVFGGYQLGQQSFFSYGYRFSRESAEARPIVQPSGSAPAAVIPKYLYEVYAKFGSGFFAVGGGVASLKDGLPASVHLPGVHSANVFRGLNQPRQSRTAHKVVWSGRYLYVLGGEGYSGQSASPPIEHYNENSFPFGMRFDPLSGMWSVIASIPDTRISIDPAACMVSGKLFFFGGDVKGTDEEKQESNRGFLYDESSDSWKETAQQGRPSRRSQAGATAIGGRVLVLGGIESIQQRFGGMSYVVFAKGGGYYDVLTDTWDRADFAEDFAAGEFGIDFDGNEVSIFGGFADQMMLRAPLRSAAPVWFAIEK